MNIKDFINSSQQSNSWFWIWNLNGMGWNPLTPQESKKRFYMAILWWNIAFNILYFLVKFWNIKWAWEIFDKLLWIISPIPPLSIFIYLQLFVSWIYLKEIFSWTRQVTKENIMWIINVFNVTVLVVLINILIWTYLWTSTTQLWAIWFITLILSFGWFVYSFKSFIQLAKDVYTTLTTKSEVVEEINEEPEQVIERYDWISKYYGFNLREWRWNPYTEEVVGKKWRFHRFQIDSFINQLIWIVNNVLLIEQSKLIKKEIYDQRKKETYVQIDAPVINTQEDMDKYLKELNFVNDYVQINNAFIALKLNTSFLSNPEHLIKIGESILPDQKLQVIRSAKFTPLKKLDPESDDYKQMIAEYKEPYVLFQSVNIQKIWVSWYVVFNYTKWYRRLVIFPQMPTLTQVLAQENAPKFKETNPLVFFGARTTWWLVWLTLQKIKHTIFGWESWSWKSVYLNSIIYQLLYRSTPETLKLVLIDPLKVSFQKLKKLKSLAFPLAMDIESANEAINFLVEQQKERYTILESLWYEDIYSYNKDVQKGIISVKDDIWLTQKYRLPGNTRFDVSHYTEIDPRIIEKKSTKNIRVWDTIPQIIMVYDEFNAFNWSTMYEKNWSVEKLVKLGEQARKAWIILCLWTQKISADTVPSSLRENLATKVALTVWSRNNSRALLGDGPENNTEAVNLTWYGDMLIFNKVELDPLYAIRAQGFYVSDEEMNNLILDSIEAFGMNDFIYQEWETDEYSWIKDFYSREPIEYETWEKLPDEIIEKNIRSYKHLWIDMSKDLPLLIRDLNKFFKLNRDSLLDKINLDDWRKNITVDSPKYQTETQMLEEFKTLWYSNQYYASTKSFIRLRLNTAYLSSPDKLEALEDKMNLQLIDLKKRVTYTPVVPFEEWSDDYIKMLKDYEVPYTLIENFQIIRAKANFYLQINYTPTYKKTVVFPQSKTIRQQLTEKYWQKIESMLNWETFTIKR